VRSTLHTYVHEGMYVLRSTAKKGKKVTCEVEKVLQLLIGDCVGHIRRVLEEIPFSSRLLEVLLEYLNQTMQVLRPVVRSRTFVDGLNPVSRPDSRG
jgi:hypothetical protein